MQVFIVMRETICSGNEHSLWDVTRVFSSMTAAQKFIIQQKHHFGSEVEYRIDTEEVYA